MRARSGHWYIDFVGSFDSPSSLVGFAPRIIMLRGLRRAGAPTVKKILKDREIVCSWPFAARLIGPVCVLLALQRQKVVERFDVTAGRLFGKSAIGGFAHRHFSRGPILLDVDRA